MAGTSPATTFSLALVGLVGPLQIRVHHITGRRRGFARENRTARKWMDAFRNNGATF
jgi:hypothetical protein